MKIEIFSDINCPFCYIGKKHLDQALESLPFKDDLEIVYKGYQLDPNLPIQGLDMSKEQYLIEHKGYPKEQIQGMFNQIKQAGVQLGITMNLESIIPVNTLRAQKLVQLAQDKQVVSQVEDLLFKAHFTDGKNIGDIELLKQIGQQANLDAKEVQQALNSVELDNRITKDIQLAKEIGVTGVPFFILDRKYAISGAQPIQAFISGITQAYDNSKVDNNNTDNGASCSTDGCC